MDRFYPIFVDSLTLAYPILMFGWGRITCKSSMNQPDITYKHICNGWDQRSKSQSERKAAC